MSFSPIATRRATLPKKTMKPLYLRCSNCTGQAVLTVIMMTAVAVVAAGGVVSLARIARQNAVYEVNQKKAYYIAEAGVEQALAAARNEPARVGSLRGSWDLLAGGLNRAAGYAGGTLERVIIRKTGEDGIATTLAIESRGRYGTCTRTLKAVAEMENLDPAGVFKGVWINNSNLPDGHCFDLTADILVSGGDVLFCKGSHLQSNVYVSGKVILESGRDEVSCIGGDVYALGGLELRGPALPVIDGRVFVDSRDKVTGAGMVLRHAGDGLVETPVDDVIVRLATEQLAARIPETTSFPQLLNVGRLEWYRDNAGFVALPPDLDFTGENSGIYYLDHSVELAGTYCGNALVVVNGDVSLGKLVAREDQDDAAGTRSSLMILATGYINILGAGQEVQALLYAGKAVELAGGARLRGSIVAPALEGQDATVAVDYSEEMVKWHRQRLNWSTCFIRLTGWTE